MGTKLEGKSYLPGYFVMGDPDLSSNSSWPRFYEKTQSGHLFNDFVLRPTHGYSEYDKEILKRTMLEQEAVFRKQVCELHRLYRIQKDLMEQFEKKEAYGHSRLGVVSHSNSLSSHLASEGIKRICQIPTLGHVGTKPSYFLKEGSVQSSPSGVHLQDGRPKFSKMLDLRLPADVFIDNEESDGIKNTVDSSSKAFDTLAGIHSTDHWDDVKLTLGASEGNKYKEGNRISDMVAENNHLYKIVADLNKPIADICNEGISRASACIDFVGPKNYAVQNNWHRLSTRSDTNFPGLSRGPFKDGDNRKGSSSNLFGANYEETRQNSFVRKESDQKDTLTWFRQIPMDVVENSGRNYFIGSSHARLAVLPTTASSFTKHHLESSIAGTPPVLPWLKTINGLNCFPVAVQEPSFNATLKLYEGTSDLAAEHRSTDGRKWESSIFPGELSHICNNGSPSAMNLAHRSFKGMQHRDAECWIDDQVQSDHTVQGDRFINKMVNTVDKKGGCTVSVDLNKTYMALGPAADSRCWMVGDSGELAKQSELLGLPVADDIAPNVYSLAESEKRSTPIRNFIDLNDAIPCTDDPKSPEDFSPGQSGILLSKSVPSIDLEAPKIHQSDGVPEKECSPDSSVVLAAETLLAMSEDKGGCWLRISCRPSSSMDDVLCWFADAVTSNEGEKNQSDDEMDLFESMTLKLEETKIEECWCEPKAAEYKSEEEIGAPSLLLTRPRRGQARRRRQRRDFQKDILPGLASLSRNEVTEDLQALGGLMKASGTARQSASMSRGGRTVSRAKGMKQRRSLAVTVAEVRVSPPPPRPAAAELDAELDGGSIIGWGRTTRRRRRRQRCPSGNASAHLT